MFIDLREIEREKKTSMWERNTDHLPPIGTLTGDPAVVT